MDECRRRLRRKEDSDPWFAQVGHFIGFSYLPLNSWQVLCAPGTSSFLLSSVAFYTYCFLYSLKYAKRSRLAKGFTQLCALYFDVIVFSLKVILRATFKNLWKYIHMTIHWNRSQWYKVKGNCPLLPPISCSYFLDTHFLGIHVFIQEICTHTHTFMSIFYIQNLFPEPFCLLSVGHQEAAQSERRKIQFSSFTNMDSQLISLTTASPYFNPPQICFQSHFPKILLSSGLCQSLQCSLQSVSTFLCLTFRAFFILLHSIY